MAIQLDGCCEKRRFVRVVFCSQASVFVTYVDVAAFLVVLPARRVRGVFTFEATL